MASSTDQTGHAATLLGLDTSRYAKTTGTPNLNARLDGIYSYGLRIAYPQGDGFIAVLDRAYAVRDTDGKPSHTTKQHIGYVERALGNAGCHAITEEYDGEQLWTVWSCGGY